LLRAAGAPWLPDEINAGRLEYYSFLLAGILLLNLAVADLSFVVVIPPSTAYVFAANR